MILLALAMAVQAAPYSGPANSKVEVNGHTYRVFVRDGEVKVFNKSALSALGTKGGRSTERRDEMRQAVAKATGCQIVDDFWRNQVLAGSIRCGK